MLEQLACLHCTQAFRYRHAWLKDILAGPGQGAGDHHFRNDGDVCIEREQVSSGVLLVRLVVGDFLPRKQLFHVRGLEAYDLAKQPASLRKQHLGFRGSGDASALQMLA
ncbi:hypothetical protein [Alcaligenes faecalis]|uniref:hypothetical protein n=1 Tax=Alcaligenes faecalis TaxID=511 RepID=UPI001C82CBE6|nr:hypothetical protein [Alcaligenes faecalis]MBX6964224.1 hypothetical protein [Providencia rettgeri]MBX7029399.1 hypothetical protein [Alcaligenes faecalis]